MMSEQELNLFKIILKDSTTKSVEAVPYSEFHYSQKGVMISPDLTTKGDFQRLLTKSIKFGHQKFQETSKYLGLLLKPFITPYI
jgi:hypothetical protein